MMTSYLGLGAYGLADDYAERSPWSAKKSNLESDFTFAGYEVPRSTGAQAALRCRPGREQK